MSSRKHISWKKRCAIFALALGDVPYEDAKQMTEDQILSLYHLDHNMLHEGGHPDREKFWNFTPRLIREHREKSKRDAKIIAKGRRIRRRRGITEKMVQHELFPGLASVGDVPLGAGNQAMLSIADALSSGLREGVKSAMERIARDPRNEKYSEGWARIFGKSKRKIRSRGFDKTKTRRMDGTVTERKNSSSRSPRCSKS